MDDMMSALFGAMGGGMGGGMGPMGMMMGGGGGRRGMRRRGEDVGHPLTVTLEQLYNGATVTVQRDRTVLCRTCQGSGCSRPGSTAVCRKCRGQGMCIGVRSIGPGFMQQVPMRCDSCSGTGSTIDPRDRCATCNATRTQQVAAPLRVQIQPGMDNKHQIPFLGEGDVEPEVPEPGAVVIILQQQPHSRFERVGNDLVVKRKISLADALCGFAFPLEHLDGRVLNLKLAPGKFAKPDMRMCVRGEGMPIFNQRQNSPTGSYGDLVVEFEVEFPERLSAEAQATLKKALPPVPAPPQDYDAAEAEVAFVTRANLADIRAQLARDAADEDDDDDSNGGGGGIRCAHQ